MLDDEEVQCDFCPKVVNEKVIVQHGDASLCPECSEKWVAEFEACEHEWEQRESDEYRVCKKCNGSDFE